MKYLRFIFLLLIVTAVSCSKTDTQYNSVVDPTNTSWLVDVNDIIHLGSEKDKIKSLDTLLFTSPGLSTLEDDEMVLAYSHNGIVHIYPMSVMEVHEIINDSIDDHYFSITHCPLTASSLAWNREIKGEIRSFGISGQLFKENLIPYDRNSGSNWSQMLSLCINGPLVGEELQTLHLIKTKYSTIKEFYPDAMVLDHSHCNELGCIRGLKNSNEEPDSGSNSDIVDTEKYYGLVSPNAVSLFPLSFVNRDLKLVYLNSPNSGTMLLTSDSLALLTAYYTNGRSFTIVYDSLPLIMKDNEGNYYDLFGYVVEGDGIGMRLDRPTSFNAHTFAWKNIFDSRANISLIE